MFIKDDASEEGAQAQERPRDSAMKGMAMSNKQGSSAFIPMTTILCGAAAVVAAIVIVGAAVTFSPRQAQATPAYAAQTGQACGACHTNSAGGGALTSRGKAFQKSHK
jgi:mono/diheme cytochrome c family protein